MARTLTILGLILGLLIPSFVLAGMNIVGGLTREKVVAPGEIFEEKISIQNTGNYMQDIKIYQTDYRFYCNGKNLYGDPGSDPRSNAQWITLNETRVSIEPKKGTEVYYQVKVPQVDSLEGTYWSMIMVEGLLQLNPESFKNANVGINTVMRYGIQVVTHIGNSGNRELKFIGAELLDNESKKYFQIDIENTGQRWLRPNIWIEVYNQDGNQIGKFNGVPLRTYPGTSVRQKIDLGEIPEGLYKVLVVADCGGDDLFGMHCKLNINQ